ncbi:WbqC family protein [Maribacter sp. HTCC2170]|uniref:WbqC family protein n=1 Tax=Maribacter sp. (strain HTCC2170 / KCCM 42371) TaxID=313603 RepID=UPI00031E2F28|nr:WbqC family protein [Maribacter sp. HTCC2170]
MKTLIHPTYFPNIMIFATIVQNDAIWEAQDNYQKQTYRNRCYVSTDQGKQILSIPIKHVGGTQGRQKYKDVQIENDYKWQRQHWRTLQTAYRTSPFFEYYEDEIAPIFENEFKFLFDLNLKTIEVISDCLQIEMAQDQTETYKVDLQSTILDARSLVSCKKEHPFKQEAYVQVFGDRHGFIQNVSVLDLLFNEGTNTLSYLNNINLGFTNG